MKNSNNHLPEKFYQDVLSSIPVPCVDAIIIYKNKFLLGKRINEPAKGKWWLIGGRIHKGETMKKAVKRKVQEETKLKIKTVEFLTNDETIFKTSHLGVSSHTINSIFIVRVSSIEKLKKDNQHSELKWFENINPRWGKYIKNSLKMAGFRE